MSGAAHGNYKNARCKMQNAKCRVCDAIVKCKVQNAKRKVSGRENAP